VSYTDSHHRPWTFQAIHCEERHADDSVGQWAWAVAPELAVNRRTVSVVATQGGRQRWHIENQGFNTQKNSRLNLEHAYGHGSSWAAYYFLLQIAHLLLQLVEKGSLLRQLASELGRTPVQLFGSLKNMAQRLLESVRYWVWPAAADATAGAMQIRFFDSS